MLSVNRIKPVLKGIKTLIPGMSEFPGTGGTELPRYCYSVWLRHLSVLNTAGMVEYPKAISELGPGNSIGVGLAGLIGGAEKYYALDVVRHASNSHNLKVFEGLIPLLRNQEAIPDDDEFPRLLPRLASYDFPSNVFGSAYLADCLKEDRINRIRNTAGIVPDTIDEDSSINYLCPWFAPDVIRRESIDLVYSQAVLEHVDDLELTYSALHSWLRKGGYMSHQIDFKSHGLTDEWNGHLSYSPFAWRLIRGGRPYLINRQVLSTHLDMMKKHGFQILSVIPVRRTDGLTRSQLSRQYRDLSEEDFTTSSSHVVARKL